MTKRVDLIRQISKAAKRRGLVFEVAREGGRHTVFDLDGARIPIPRHNEIGEQLAEVIRKQAAEKLGEGWWRR